MRLNILQPVCRTRLSLADFEFLRRTLSPDQDLEALMAVCIDDDALDLVLDSSSLYEAIRCSGDWLDLSPYLYFYILVRNTLLEASIDDRDLADYVATILSEFGDSRKLWPDATDTRFDYVVDILKAVAAESGYQRFATLVHGANATLFLTGMYAGRIRRRRERHGGPALPYYETQASCLYELASRHALAEEFALRAVFRILADEFPRIRRALAGIAHDALGQDHGDAQ